MYEQWPFFAATIDLIEMILAKADMRIAALYDDVLVDDPVEKKLGAELRQKFGDTERAILEVGRGGAGWGCDMMQDNRGGGPGWGCDMMQDNRGGAWVGV